MVVGRLAPTPSGRLHLGNVTAFGAAWLSVRQQGGELLLRVEDVDTTRARAELESELRADLTWLGLHWDRETRRQSERDYAPALARLDAHTYRCQCSRQKIRDAGELYTGACREAGHTTGAVRIRAPEATVQFTDRVWGERTVQLTAGSDTVLRRSDGVYAYTLAVVADDLEDGVTEVVRGADLLDMTALQQHIWGLLGGAAPTWLHTPVILGTDGRKLSKSHSSTEVAALRASGWTPDDVWRVVLPWLGLAAMPLHEAVAHFSPEAIRDRQIPLAQDPPRR